MNKMFKINDASQKCGDVVQHAEQFLPFAHKKMGFQKPISINLVSDPKNAKNPLGKTAYYDPNELKITVFVDNRHLKDILRSLAHELVHHTQNCRGDLGGNNYTGPGYAQKDKHMRKMEGEAYLSGNLCFRDWEDSLKGRTTMAENKNIDEGGPRGPGGTAMAAAFKPFVDYINSEREKGKNNKSIYDQISKFVKDLFQPADDTSNMSAADLLKLTNKTSDKNSLRVSDDARSANKLARNVDEENQSLKKENKVMEIKETKEFSVKYSDLDAEAQTIAQALGHASDKVYLVKNASDLKHAKSLTKAKLKAQQKRKKEKSKELEEGGAAARTGNEDRDAGRGRMSADRVHENEELEEGEEVVEEGDDEKIAAEKAAEAAKKAQEAAKEAAKKAAAKKAGRAAANKVSKALDDAGASKQENWTRGSKDQLLFERLVKKWAK
jgi:hypothetical protein